MKKKLIFIFFVLLGSALSAGAVNTTGDRYRYHRHKKHYNYDRDQDKDRKVEDIEYRLDILQDEYKREKERLKAKKKAIKNDY